MKTKGASGQWRRAASSRFNVPVALTSKSSNGRSFARSWEGCAAQWMTAPIGCVANTSVTAAGSRMSTGWWAKSRTPSTSCLSRHVVSPGGPKKSARMLLSRPWTRWPRRAKYSTASEPIRPLDPVTRICTERRLVELEFDESGPAHAQHDEPVAKPADHFCFAADPLLIMHGQVDDAQVKLGGAEQQVVIAPAIVGAPGADERPDGRPVAAPQHLGAAQGVAQAVSQQHGDEPAEEAVADGVERPHRDGVHRKDEARAVDELRPAAGDRVVEIIQLLGR